MRMCWNLEPTERPTFSKISQMIEQQLGGQLEPGQVNCYTQFFMFLIPGQNCGGKITIKNQWFSFARKLLLYPEHYKIICLNQFILLFRPLKSFF